MVLEYIVQVSFIYPGRDRLVSQNVTLIKGLLGRIELMKRNISKGILCELAIEYELWAILNINRGDKDLTLTFSIMAPSCKKRFMNSITTLKDSDMAKCNTFPCSWQAGNVRMSNSDSLSVKFQAQAKMPRILQVGLGQHFDIQIIVYCT
jgi:hypothetical protein